MTHPLPTTPRRDTAAWRMQVWISFGVAASLCLLTLPLGLPLWKDFFGVSMANADVFANYDAYKLVTLRGFMEGMLGRSSLTSALWAVAASGLVVAAVVAWRTPGSPLRHLGIGLLLAIAANPYAQFYDALVLAVPATIWWAEQDRWRRGPWLIVGTLLAVAWCGEQWLHAWGALTTAAGLGWLPTVSIVGPVAAVWLMLAATQTSDSSVIVRNSGRNWPQPKIGAD